MIVADTMPPTITPLFTQGGDQAKAKSLQFRIGDNFSGVASWALMIDGKRVPCDRYPSRGTVVYEFSASPTGTSHTVELTVKDAVGNTTTWRGRYKR